MAQENLDTGLQKLKELENVDLQKIIDAINSPRLNEVVKEIENFRKTNNIAMDHESYLALIKEKKLEGIALYPAGMTWVKSQKSNVSKELLKELYKAKIESVSTFYCEYKSTTKEKDKVSYNKNRFAIDGRKVFSETYEGNIADRLNLTKRNAFDGNCWRNTQCFLDDSNQYAGEISKNSGERSIYGETDVLKYTLLRKSPEGLIGVSAYDILKYLDQNEAVVQEKPVTDEGVKCLLLYDGNIEIYLDPERDYTVKKVLQYRPLFDEQGVLDKRELLYKRVHSDFINYGNGIWIPKKIEEQNVTYDRQETIELIDCKVNMPLESSLFTDNIFVEGAYVKDLIKGFGYVVGYPHGVEKNVNKLLESENIIPPANASPPEKTQKKATKVNDLNSVSDVPLASNPALKQLPWFSIAASSLVVIAIVLALKIKPRKKT
jgi:hypothetical protein